MAQAPKFGGMIKVLTWFTRKPGLAVEEFRTYWRHEHPKVVLNLPGLQAYNQNHVTDAGYAKGRQPYADGVAETWWDSLDALQAHRGTAALDAVMADEGHFIDPDRRHSLVVEEKVVVDGQAGPGALKQITWLTRRPDLTPEQCHTHWWDNHGPLGAKVPGMVRYVQNHVPARAYRDGRQPIHDGLAIVHLASLEAARTAATSPELAATRADEANFLDLDRLPFVVVDEIRIL